MKVLSLDSATEAATCSIIDDDRLLGEITFNYKKQHSTILMPMIDNLLTNLNLDIESIDGFVVSKGPGSFTGLRIGLATIKGLCQATNKPFVSICTLDALAYNMAYTTGIICPILDALRDNVYTALYTFENNELKRLSEHMVISINDLIVLIKGYNEPACFIGDATLKFKDQLKEALTTSSFAPVHLNLVKASSLAELGITLLKNGTYEDLFDSAPIYLRKSQAEREYELRMGKDANE